MRLTEEASHSSALIMSTRDNYIIVWVKQSWFGLFIKQRGHSLKVGQANSRLGLNFLLFGIKTWEMTRLMPKQPAMED